LCDINERVVAHQIVRGAYNAELFDNFVLEKLVPIMSGTQKILVMDNAKIYHSPRVINTFAVNRIDYRFLSAHSPQKNPIEEFFSALKANYKTILAEISDPLNPNITELLNGVKCSIHPPYWG
jgi:transposase